MYKLFIVDDEPLIIEGLCDIVNWAEYEIEIVGVAYNGLKALENLKHVSADILLTDISMPKMNGLQLIQAVREFQPDMKMIVLSGYDDFTYAKEGLKLGIENYLLKPVDVVELQSTVRAVVDKLSIVREEYSYQQYCSMVLRDNIMQRWLTNQIQQREFIERAQLIGIELNHPYILTTIIQLDHSIQVGMEHIMDITGQEKSIIPFVDLHGHIVVLYNFDDVGRGMKEVEEMNDQIIQVLSSTFTLQVSVGSLEETAVNPARSYANAQEAQEYFMFYLEKNVLRYEELKKHQVDIDHNFPIDWNNYSKLIMAKDNVKLAELINSDFKSLYTNDRCTPRFLQDVAIEWVIRFKIQLEEIKYMDQSRINSNIFEKIRSISSIEELLQNLIEVSSIIADTLASEGKSPIVHQVQQYIDQAYHESLSLKLLGARFHIHPVYLGQLFSKELNLSFTNYMNRLRVEKTKELLRDTQLKVQEIAERVGYKEMGYFYKQFKKYVGVSPLEYKEMF